jgi:WD40 repeat protein
VLSGHTHGVSDTAISKKSGFVYSSSGDGTVRVWDPGRKYSVDQMISPHDCSVNTLVCTSNGERMVTACETGLSIWDIKNLQILDKIDTRGTISLAITPDGCHAILGTRDGILKIWDLEENSLVESLTGHGSYINDVSIYAHGKRAISASHDNSLWIWDLDDLRGSNILMGHKRPVTAVTVTRDDKWAISAAEDGTLIIWDLSSASMSHQFSSHSTTIRSLALFPDQQRIICGTEDNVLKVLDLETGKLVWQLSGHSGPVLDIDISPSGDEIISASGDHTLKLWSSLEATDISTFTGDNSMASCKFCPDNKKIFAGDVSGRVHILNIMA